MLCNVCSQLKSEGYLKVVPLWLASVAYGLLDSYSNWRKYKNSMELFEENIYKWYAICWEIYEMGAVIKRVKGTWANI